MELNGAVFAPEVFLDATSDKVLTTRWIDGQRLDEVKSIINKEELDGSDSDSEVMRLCKLALK